MTLAALRAAALQAQANRAALGLDPATARMIVVIPRRPGRSEYMCLDGRRGPLGRVVGSTRAGHAILDVLAADILAWTRHMEPPTHCSACRDVLDAGRCAGCDRVPGDCRC